LEAVGWWGFSEKLNYLLIYWANILDSVLAATLMAKRHEDLPLLQGFGVDRSPEMLAERREQREPDIQVYD
jgi:hypothetical protein